MVTSRNPRSTALGESVEIALQAYEFYGFKPKNRDELIRLAVIRWEAECEKYNLHWIKYVKHRLSSYFVARVNWASSRGRRGSNTSRLRHMVNVPPLGADDSQMNLLGREAEHWVSGNHGPKGKALYSFLVTILTGVKKGCPRGQKEEAEDAAWKSFKKLIGEEGKIPESFQLTTILTRTFEELEMKEDFNSASYETIRQALHDSVVLFHLTEEERMRRQFAATLADIVGEVFKDGSWRAEDALKIVMPSTNSTYTHPRKEGGAVGAIKVLFEELKASKRLSEKSLIEKDISEEEDAWNAMRAIQLDEKEEKKTQKQPTQTIDALPLYQEWLITVYPALLKKAVETENLVSTVALTEALKFRTITKGNAFRQTVLKPLQQFLHKTMRNHPTFKYIGEEVSADKLSNDFGYIPDWASHMISGDWSDATNELYSFASEYAGLLIAKRIGLDATETQLFLESLTGHTLVYKGKDVENRYRQRRGQLMGSITSFPVLCLINAAVCKQTFEDSIPQYVKDKIRRNQKGNKAAKPHRLRLSDIPLRINGDDLLMAGTILTDRLLEKRGRVVGLLSSVGKSYSHGGYANMNSTSFLTQIKKHGSAAKCTFELIPYINFGLLNGYRRSTSSEDRDDIRVSDLGSIATALLEAAPQELRETLLDAFVRRHEKLLKGSKLPWYLPTHVGGVGLPIVGRTGRMIQDVVDERLPRIKTLVEEDVREMKLTDARIIEEETKRLVERELDEELWEYFDEEVRGAHKPSKVDFGLAKAVLVKHKRVMPPAAISNWHLWTLLMKRFEMYRYEADDPRLERAQQATNCIFVDMLLHEPLENVFHKEQTADGKWARYNAKLYDPSKQRIAGGHVKLTRIYSVLFRQTLSVGLLQGKNLALSDLDTQEDLAGGLN